MDVHLGLYFAKFSPVMLHLIARQAHESPKLMIIYVQTAANTVKGLFVKKSTSDNDFILGIRFLFGNGGFTDFILLKNA